MQQKHVRLDLSGSLCMGGSSSVGGDIYPSPCSAYAYVLYKRRE